MALQLPDVLEEHTIGRYWGVTPESILLYINTTVTDSAAARDTFRRYYDLTVYVNNHKVDWETYTAGLDSIVDSWFDPVTRRLAQHATPQAARQFVLGAAYEAGGGIMRLLRTAQEQAEETDSDEPLILPRRDAQAIANEQDIDLLRTFGMLLTQEEGYHLHRETIKALHGSRELTPPEARWAILARLCRAHSITEIETVVPSILDGFEVPLPDKPPETIGGSLPIYAGDDRVRDFVTTLFGTEAVNVFTELETGYEGRETRLERTLGLRRSETPEETPKWPLTDSQAAVCAVASQQRLPVASGWLLDHGIADDEYELHRMLADADISVSLNEDLLNFEKAYGGPTDIDALAAYEEWVKKKRKEAATISSAARRLRQKLDTAWAEQRNALLASAMEQLDDVNVAPIQFTFTVFDPVHHADEYEIDEYVGDSPHLEDEVNRISEWRANQPHDAVTFAKQVREICARPLEEDSVAPRLRVMSPWINFTIQEYTALFQRLLENDIRVQLLFRLPDSREWTGLKQNLLTRIGDTRGNLELRTYTRYKKFKDHTQLQKHRRGEFDDEGDQFVTETGVHAKLFIAGNPDDGDVLAGSANLMENSFYYNPEAGLHTRHPEVVDTAIDYFDLIWKLAEPDQIDESVFTAETNFEFYPKVYRP